MVNNIAIKSIFFTTLILIFIAIQTGFAFSQSLYGNEIEEEVTGNTYYIYNVNIAGHRNVNVFVTFHRNRVYTVKIKGRDISMDHNWWVSQSQLCTSVSGGKCFYISKNPLTGNLKNDIGIEYLRIQ